MKFVWTTLFVMTLAAVLGCGDAGPEPVASTGGSAPPPPAPAPSGPVASDDPADSAAAPADAPAENMPAETPAAGAPAGNAEEAKVGVGAKGRNYGGPGLVTTPIEAYFRAQERINFEAQIPNAMKLYKASHDNKGPKTQEEYMEIIIKENGVKLPELPEGDEYFYDPATEKLMVRHPASEQPNP